MTNLARFIDTRQVAFTVLCDVFRPSDLDFGPIWSQFGPKIHGMIGPGKCGTKCQGWIMQDLKMQEHLEMRRTFLS